MFIGVLVGVVEYRSLEEVSAHLEPAVLWNYLSRRDCDFTASNK
jgi:hypothetical protein